MTDKLLISKLTWRSLDMQKEAFPNIPTFFAPDDIENLFRKTNRNDSIRVHVLSLAVIADNEKDFRDFLFLAKKRGCSLHAIEEQQVFEFNSKFHNFDRVVNEWRKARRNGSARIGAAISAKNKRNRTAAGIARIKDRWPMGSGIWPTRVLLEEAGLSLNTVKSVLGSRPLAQANYEAAQKIKERRNARR